MSESTESKHLASTPYHEPSISIILVQSSFLLLLNIVNYLLDRAVYCGLLGQVFIGVAWGTPGANWIGGHGEEVVVQLGYLGLLLLVYEGGLSTSLSSLKANLFLSSWVALTGIALPIGLSFILQYVCDATPLQCFAAGAALSSTSLGTTFTVLSTSGLAKSRLGVVLTSAAMMDDVIGLVMVQIISNLGQDSSSFDAIVVVRPLLVSLAFAVLAPLICILGVAPATRWLNKFREKNPKGYLNRLLGSRHVPFILHTLILLGYIAASSYAGTSNLFAAYIAGASISWWDAQVSHIQASSAGNATSAATNPPGANDALHDGSGLDTYERVYSVTVNRVLRPFFFASIGFSIPITKMFTAEVVWKGLVYTLFMMLGKLFCGVWLLRLPDRLKQVVPKALRKRDQKGAIENSTSQAGTPTAADSTAATEDASRDNDGASGDAPSDASAGAEEHATDEASGEDVSRTGGQDVVTSVAATLRTDAPGETVQATVPAGVKPRSIYPASMLGCAMMARGEIGFLISSIAESKGIFANGAETTSVSKIFLCVTWAILLCTVIGPLAVGLLVQRVKKLQRRVEASGSQVKGDVLGVWGVE